MFSQPETVWSIAPSAPVIFAGIVSDNYHN